MPTVLITHTPSALETYFGARAIAALEALVQVRRNPLEQPLGAAELIEAAAGCDFIIADRATQGPAAVFQGLPQLVAFSRCAVDIRNIDVAAAGACGVLVTQASAGFMASVAEWIVGVMIDLARHITPANAAYHAGRVPPIRMGRELRGSTIGIIGYGQISRHLAGLARAFGMRVLVTDPYVRIEDIEGGSIRTEHVRTEDVRGNDSGAAQGSLAQVPLPQLLKAADFVICLAKATEETENLMDAEAFAAMQPTAYFINAARGNLVDEDALLAALDAGTLAGCALDVGRAADQMPSPGLAKHPRVIATPHVGGLTPPAIEHQALEVVEQLAAILRGEVPAGAVNAAEASRLAGFWSRP